MIDQETFDKVRQEREKKQKEAELLKQHEDKVGHAVIGNISNLTAFVKLIEFLQGHTTKTEITNHLKDIGTPDVLKLIPELDKLRTAVEDNKVSLRPLANQLAKIETQLSTLPRVFPEAPEPREDVKVTNLSEIDTKSIVDAINQLDLNVEAPIINTEKVDLQPLQRALKGVLEAVKGIYIPEDKSPFVEAGEDAQARLRNGMVETVQTNILVDEKYDEYVIKYDALSQMDSEMETIVQGMQYFLDGNLVAEIRYEYSNGNLVRVRKVKLA